MTADDPAQVPQLRLSSAAGRWVLLATVLGSSMALLDSTVVNVALPTIGRHLNASLAGPPVDGHRLHPHAGRAHPARRVTRRQARPPPRLPHRGRVVRAGLGPLRAGAEHWRAHRGARAPGRRRRPADAGLARDHPGQLRCRGPAACGRRLVGSGRRRFRYRPARRRAAGPDRGLALGVPAEPAGCRRGSRRDDAARARDQGYLGARRLRRRRGGSRGAGPCRHHLRAHRGAREVRQGSRRRC